MGVVLLVEVGNDLFWRISIFLSSRSVASYNHISYVIVIHIIYTIYMYSKTPIYRGFWGKETSAVNQGSR